LSGMRFLHCSDVHITQSYAGAPWRKIGWRRWLALLELSIGGRAAAYARAGETLARIAGDLKNQGADHLILSGDLTAYAVDSEFQGARDALGELGGDKRRCTVIPGNHDRYTPGSLRAKRFEKYFGHLLESDLPEVSREGPFPFVRLLGEEAAVIGMCSARVPPVPGLSYGTIGEAQLDGLREAVAHPRLKGRAVLVVVHHAPLTSRGTKDKLTHGLRDAEKLFALIPGPRFAVLHGHIHHRYHHPATSTRPHVFGAGSSTCAGMEGYWLIDVANGQIAGGTKQEVSRPIKLSTAA
jgi:3',5'-cyclic AMP phosphodiesterase CpdA